jgi:hypothetical protein
MSDQVQYPDQRPLPDPAIAEENERKAKERAHRVLEAKAAKDAEPKVTAMEDPEVAAQHSAAEEEYLQNLYTELKPEAAAMYLNFFLARTPADLQEDMKAIVEADLATPPTPPVADPPAL